MALLSCSDDSSMEVACDPSLVYEILTSYDDYFEWLVFMTHSKLLAEEGDLAITEFGHGDKGSRLVAECIHSKNRSVLIRRISGDLPVRELEWRIDSQGPTRCVVSLRVDFDRRWKNLRPARSHQWRSRALLASLKSRVTTFSSSFPLTSESGQKVLELMQTEQGLILFLMGEKYLLKPLTGEES